MNSLQKAVCLCAYDHTNSLMLASHKRHDSSQWGLPGGKIKNNESSIQAIIRETSEETPYLIAETSLKFITKKICFGETNYLVDVYLIENPLHMTINTKINSLEQNYGWIHPRLLTVGPFGKFNSELFKDFKDLIFGTTYDSLKWYN